LPASQKTLQCQFASFRHGNPLTCLHFGDALSDGIAILLTAQSVHCLSMNVGIDDEVHPLRARIDDFKLTVTGRLQSVGQFFGEFCGHSRIIPHFDVQGEERSAEIRPQIKELATQHADDPSASFA
jgi:hypothetical protein